MERLRLLRLLAKGGLWPTLGLTVAYVAMNGIPLAMAFASASLVSNVISLRLTQGSITNLVGPLAVVGLLLVLDQVLPAVVAPLEMFVARRIDGVLREDLRRAAMAPVTVRHVESPEFQDQIEGVLGRRADRTLGTGTNAQLIVVVRTAGALLSAALLATFSIWLALTLFIVMWLVRSRILKLMGETSRLIAGRVPHARRARYWSEMAAGAKSAKEVRLFGAASWLADRFELAALQAIAPRGTFAQTTIRFQFVSFVANAAAVVATWYALGTADMAREISHGDLVRYVQLASAIFTLGLIGYEEFAIDSALRALRSIDRLKEMAADSMSREAVVSPVFRHAKAEGIRFEHVTFSYGTGTSPVFANLTLDIPSGQSLAIVGNNGAGKTTLIKLLTGLYTPDRGRILVNGLDLREVDQRWWRREVAVIFQDFTSYPLSARENVTLGFRSSPGDEELNEIGRAAGALSVVEKLPHGWETVLSRQYDGGTDLSGGEWQRMILARALFAQRQGASVLILDEPTANLDIRAESEIFGALLDQRVPGTIILVSHRLSSVRKADRIVLLNDGEVSEDGSHDELMASGQEYARMFELQASRFRDETEATAT